MPSAELLESSTRRYEAFSDVVIGFCLAQLSLTLRIPAHGAELISDPRWLLDFLWAFANVCGMWWFHHRLFTSFWRPKMWPILINFAWLATVILCMYATQLAIQLDDPISGQLYFGFFALAYFLLALQYYIGRKEAGDSELAQLRSHRGVMMMLLWGMTFVAAGFIYFLPRDVHFVTWIPFTVAAALSTAIARWFRRQELALT